MNEQLLALHMIATEPEPWYSNFSGGEGSCLVRSCDRRTDGKITVRRADYLLCEQHYSELTRTRKQLRRGSAWL
jgi:hypothetical protein